MRFLLWFRKGNTIAKDTSGADTICWKCKGNGQCTTCGGTGLVMRPAEIPAEVPLPPETPLSDLERTWNRVCDTSTFIPDDKVQYFVERLNSAKRHGTVILGLAGFTKQTCLKCGESGQFKIRLLGRIEHASCGQTWYIGPLTYTRFQFLQVLQAGVLVVGIAREDADREGDRTGGWVNGVFAFFLVTAFRAVLAVVLIPIQAIVSCRSFLKNLSAK